MIESVWKKQYALKEFTASTNFKSYEELKTRLDAVLSGTVSVGNVTDTMDDEPIASPKVDTKPSTIVKDGNGNILDGNTRSKTIQDQDEDDTMDYFNKLANS